jgi:ferrous iron transport protein A
MMLYSDCKPTMDIPAPLPTLADVALHQRHVVSAVTVPGHAPEWARWLEEIGFIPGERVTLTARGMLGGDPLVVRIGSSTFALRLAEAACIVVRAEHGTAD